MNDMQTQSSKYAGIGMVLLLAAIVGIGMTLPRDYVVTRSVNIGGQPKVVHYYVGDLARWEEWAAWKRADPNIVITPGRHSSGIGAHQSWTTATDVGQLDFTDWDPEKGIKYEMKLNHGRDTNLSEIAYTPYDRATTTVTWTMKGQISMPILGGYFALAMDRMSGPMLESSLERLKVVVESKGMPYDNAPSDGAYTPTNGKPTITTPDANSAGSGVGGGG